MKNSTIFVAVSALLSLALAGSAIGAASGSDAPRSIRAVRAVRPPLVDGRLDDVCWKNAQEVTGFLGYNSNHLASVQTFAYITYDDSHLYIGVKCVMAKGIKPTAEMRPHDANIFGDDVIEIMLDPGRTRSDYYQLAINAAGSTFDCSRLIGGAHEDDAWDGEWQGKTHIADGYWSMEMAVPYNNLGISPSIGTNWGINICREGVNPKELSSISLGGAFNDATKFAVVKDMNADLSRFFFRIGPERLTMDPAADKPRAVLVTPVTNLTGKTATLKIDMHQAGPRKIDIITSRKVLLRGKESVELHLESLPMEPVFRDRTDVYVIRAAPRTKKIVLSDPDTGKTLGVAIVKKHSLCRPIRIDVADPWTARTSRRRTRKVSLTVHLGIPEEDLAGGLLSVQLLSRATGEPIAVKTVRATSSETRVKLSTRRIPWGAYDVHAAFVDAKGREIVAARAAATILPGRKHRVRILNNLVTELANAKERRLLRESEIPFMNPRDGWCFFSASGDVTLRLDGQDEPLIRATADGAPVEAMRHLPVGRHTLRIEGAPQQVIVRAIPELIYCQYKSGPHITPHGPYDWEFLYEPVLKNCNLIVGGVYPEEMAAWRAQGKKWLTHVQVPGIGTHSDMTGTISAQDSYIHWTKSQGYSHPLLDGMIADEFTARPEEQYLEWADSLRLLAADPRFKGRDFYAWCGGIYGSEAPKVFLDVLLGSRWHHCFEVYLQERPTEASARAFINDNLVRGAQGWDIGVPGSVKKVVTTLGYMSQPTESLNVYPFASYKVYMDMQFEALANAPVFFGTYAIMEYLSSYCDEENVRWAGRLYRHYAIEGNKTRLSTDPYRLTHVLNPDFDEGTEHWQLRPAREGSITTTDHAGYSWLQMRYPTTKQGDKFLLMKRAADKPNTFSQQIKGLEPGRLYSMKMITADYQDLVKEISGKKKHAVTIDLEGVDILPGAKNNFQFIFPNCYAHKLGKFDATYPYWMNYHWRVFRAKAPTAKLTVSDWASNEKPGGPIGQELIFNFIEMQPYFED